jgi:hypothetical protein
MFVIQRTDKDFCQFSKIHETLEMAKEEAERLAKKHVKEKPIFVIYELLRKRTIKSAIINRGAEDPDGYDVKIDWVW